MNSKTAADNHSWIPDYLEARAEADRLKVELAAIKSAAISAGMSPGSSVQEFLLGLGKADVDISVGPETAGSIYSR